MSSHIAFYLTEMLFTPFALWKTLIRPLRPSPTEVFPNLFFLPIELITLFFTAILFYLYFY